MSMFYGISSDNVGTLFSGLGNNQGSSTGSILSTYASIRSGAYYKLAKKYYSEPDAVESTKDKFDKKTKNTKKLETKKLNDIKTNSDNLTEDIDKLLEKGSKSLFNEVVKKDKDGKETTEYDVDSIYKAVNAFAESYNEAVSASVDAKQTSILSASSSMVKATAANSKLLGKLGIKIDKENKISVDEDTFKKADMGLAKSLFTGNGSYAYNIKANATYMSISAKNAATNVATYKNNGMYNSTGNYSSLFDSIV